MLVQTYRLLTNQQQNLLLRRIDDGKNFKKRRMFRLIFRPELGIRGENRWNNADRQSV